MIDEASTPFTNQATSFICLVAERTCCCTFCILSRMELSGSGSLLPCRAHADLVKLRQRECGLPQSTLLF
jgi:hypothetical protein